MRKVHEDATQVPRQEREISGLDLCRVTCHIFFLVAVVPPRPAPYARSLGAGARHVPTFSWLSGQGGEAHRHATFCGSCRAETNGFFNHAV